MKESSNNIIVIALLIVALVATFFLGYNKGKNSIQYWETEAIIDTVFVTKTKVIPKIQTIILKPDSIVVTETDTIFIPAITYEIATIDTTFIFADSISHHLVISYDEFQNIFDLTSTFRLCATIPTQSIYKPDSTSKMRILPFLTASWAIGENEKENYNSKYSILGIGVGIKYKNIGIGVTASSNKTAGGMILYEF